MDEPRALGIAELAQRAGVSVRTIRYYISLDMLGGPLGRGRSATYSEEDLDRLRLIRTLARQRIPLEEIRRTLAQMGLAEVRQVLTREVARSAEEAQARASSPRDYVTRLLERARPETAPVSAPLPPAVRETISAPPGPSAPKSGGRAHPRQTSAPTAWRRIPLAPGLELHVDLGLESTNGALVERILASLEPDRRQPHGDE